MQETIPLKNKQHDGVSRRQSTYEKEKKERMTLLYASLAFVGFFPLIEIIALEFSGIVFSFALTFWALGCCLICQKQKKREKQVHFDVAKHH